MFHIISHRVNDLSSLESVPITDGIEVDVRYHNDKLILEHDPFNHQQQNLVLLEDMVAAFKRNHIGTIILNIKTEGIEQACIDIMKKYDFSKWFFLDLSMPSFVIRTHKINAKSGINPDNFAVRFSEFEPIEYALSFQNKVGWAWIDCFHNLPLNSNNYKLLRAANFKLCLVSPELQHHPISKITEFQKVITKNNFYFDAICTKYPKLWRDF